MKKQNGFHTILYMYRCISNDVTFKTRNQVFLRLAAFKISK